LRSIRQSYSGDLEIARSIDEEINYLENQRRILDSYHEIRSYSSVLEYGIDSSRSCGLDLFIKTEAFKQRKYFSGVIGSFYKKALLREKDRIISISPKLYIKTDDKAPQEAIFQGAIAFSKRVERNYYSLIIDTEISGELGLSRSNLLKKTYACACNEMLKFQNGIFLGSFTKYYYEPKSHPAYRMRLYEHVYLGVDYRINTGISIGYFFHRDLFHKLCNASGLVLSFRTQS
jgi:hypothetical protein